MGILITDGKLLAVDGKLTTANAAPSTPYMEAEYVEVVDTDDYTSHYIKRAKLYNHTAICAYEFAYQYELKSLDFSDASNNITAVEESAFQSASALGLVLPHTITSLARFCFNGASIKTLTVPPLVTVLPRGAFAYIQPVYNSETGEELPISIILPQNLTKIGIDCFTGANIKQITIPDTVTEIERGAFNYCTELESFTIPPLLQKISTNMLSACPALTSIVIPASVTEIEGNAFAQSGLTSITIPSTVTMLGSSAFNGCESLTSMNIQANVTEIPEDFARNCPLTSLTFPSTLQTIGASAFLNASVFQITELTIPASVTSIEDYAFTGNNASQMTLTVLPTTPPTLGVNVFNLAAGSVIKVPAASVTAYKAADGWKDWADKIVGI